MSRLAENTLLRYTASMKNPLHTFRVIVEPDGKGYHGFVPTLRGVHTCARTIDETKKRLDEAIQCHIEGLLNDGERVPRDENSFEFVRSFSVGSSRVTAAYA